MLYIVCEDSKMGYRLWKAINDCMLGGKAKVVSSFGITNMVSTIKELGIRRGDRLFCAIDNIQGVESYKVLVWLGDNVHNIGYRYCTTNYSCVEDVFTSFEYLDKWITTLDQESREKLDTARKIINNRCKDNMDDSLVTNSKLKKMYPTANTDEQMSARIIYDITKNTGFVVSKGGLGRCWTAQCNCVQQYPEYCKAKRCGVFYYKVAEWMTRKGKIRTLWNNSILKNEDTELLIDWRHKK